MRCYQTTVRLTETKEKQYLRVITGHQPFDIEIDRLTRSIENAVSGDSFKTEVLELTLSGIEKLKKTDWLFEWKAEAKRVDKKIYKLVIVDNPNIIQGLISLQDRGDHVFMSLIESNKFNRGAKKVYLGVRATLVLLPANLHFNVDMKATCLSSLKPNWCSIILTH